MAFENLGVRSLVSIVFGPLILWVSWQGGVFFLALSVAIAGVSLVEFYNLAKEKEGTSHREVGVIAGLVVLAGHYWGGASGAAIGLAAASIGVLVAALLAGPENATRRAGNTLLGVVYVPFLLGFLVSVRELPRSAGLEYAAAGTWLVMLFGVIWICDSAAYFWGSRFGRRKLYPSVSPGKSVEGAIAGVAAALLSAWGFHLWFVKGIRLVDSLAIGLICGVVGQGSDLVESLFKRDAGVKDASHILPGHGGILDRFDSEILVAPVVYLYLWFVAF